MGVDLNEHARKSCQHGRVCACNKEGFSGCEVNEAQELTPHRNAISGGVVTSWRALQLAPQTV